MGALAESHKVGGNQNLFNPFFHSFRRWSGWNLIGVEVTQAEFSFAPLQGDFFQENNTFGHLLSNFFPIWYWYNSYK